MTAQRDSDLQAALDDALAALAQAETFGIGEFRVTQDAYQAAVNALDAHRARADTAEAAIARVKELCANRNAGPLYVHAVLAAIAGEPPCPDCGGYGTHGYITNPVAGGPGEMRYGGQMSAPCPRRAPEGER